MRVLSGPIILTSKNAFDGAAYEIWNESCQFPILHRLVCWKSAPIRRFGGLSV